MADSQTTYRTVTPCLVVSNADAELAFLKAAFGAIELNCQRRPDNTVMHAEIIIGDSIVMLGQAGGPWKPRSAALYLWVEDVDARTQKPFGRGRSPRATPKISRMATVTLESSIGTA
jgi:PhnB protein